MNKVMIALLGLTLISTAGYAQKGEPKVIAHRGFWQAQPVVPNNSIAALKNAAELKCFGTEFDVHVTSDGVPVIFHDNKTKNGINIQSVTYAELMEKDGVLANGEPISTLDEYLVVWKKSGKRVKLILEIKNHGTLERDCWAAGRILEVVREHKIKPKHIEYIAFSRDLCRALYDQKCGAPVAYLSGNLTPKEVKEELGATGIDYHMNVFKKNPDWIAEAQALGMSVNVWTVDKDEDLRHAIGSGVNYITTDRPDVLMEMLSQSAAAARGR